MTNQARVDFNPEQLLPFNDGIKFLGQTSFARRYGVSVVSVLSIVSSSVPFRPLQLGFFFFFLLNSERFV